MLTGLSSCISCLIRRIIPCTACHDESQQKRNKKNFLHIVLFLVCKVIPSAFSCNKLCKDPTLLPQYVAGLTFTAYLITTALHWELIRDFGPPSFYC